MATTISEDNAQIGIKDKADRQELAKELAHSGNNSNNNINNSKTSMASEIIKMLDKTPMATSLSMVVKPTSKVNTNPSNKPHGKQLTVTPAATSILSTTRAISRTPRTSRGRLRSFSRKMAPKGTREGMTLSHSSRETWKRCTKGKDIHMLIASTIIVTEVALSNVKLGKNIASASNKHRMAAIPLIHLLRTGMPIKEVTRCPK